MKKLGMLLGCGLMALAIGCGAEEVKTPTVAPTTVGADYKAKMEGGVAPAGDAAAPAGDAAAPAGDAAGEKKEGDAPAEKKEGDAPAEKKEGDAPAEKKEGDAPAEKKE